MSEEKEVFFDRGTLKFIGSAIFVAGVVMYFLTQEMHRQKARGAAMDVKYVQYIADRHCVVTGYAGKNAMEIYQCEHGIFLSRDIWAQLSAREKQNAVEK
jgi:hypothetical protein